MSADFDTLPPEWQTYIRRMDIAYNEWHAHLRGQRTRVLDAIRAIKNAIPGEHPGRERLAENLALHTLELAEVDLLIRLTTVPTIDEITNPEKTP